MGPDVDPFLRELGVRFVIVSPAADPFGRTAGMRLAFSDPVYRVYERRDSPRAWLAQSNAPVPATLVSDSERRFALPASEQAQTLVTGEPYYPGWHAEASGRSLNVARQGFLTTVRVPPGARTVELRYRPPGLTVGLVISLVSAALGLGLLVAARRRSG